MRNLYKMLSMLCFLLAYGQASYGQMTFTSGAGLTQTQNFDGIGSTTTATLPSGFVVSAGTVHSSGTTATTQAAGTTGAGILTGSSAGGTYNFANGVTASSTDRALGFLTSGGFASPRSIMLQMLNSSGSTITELQINFNYEKYRSGSRAYDWTFFIGSDGSNWTANSSGNQSYAADANNTVISNPPTQTNKTFTVTGLNIANGANYYMRWTFTGVGGSSNSQGIGIDDLSITAVVGASNTITAPNGFGFIFLLDCADTEDLTITGATSTGTFNAGNQYIAQLSDVSGSFASPVATTSVSSTSNTIPDMTITIPAGTPSSTGYRVRIISTNPSTTGAQTVNFLINQSGTCVSTATDYFRSRQTGNWNVADNWQSSTDNINWITATLVPDNNANVITIQTGHNVSITDARTFDQLAVNGTLTLNAGSNTITIANGTGEDLTVNNGGVVNVAGTDVSNITFTGTVGIGNGGILRYTSGGGSNIAQTLAGTSTNTQIVYANGGIFDWNNIGAFSSSGVTYFSTSGANAPIFRISQNTASVGAGTATVFNGVLEVNGTITFQNAGTKTFRNGITGTGTLTQDSGCGQFLITGTTATLAGAGTIALSTNGMSSTAATLTLNSNKTINGNTFSVTSGTFETGTNTLSGTTNFTLASGATLRTANVNGLNCIGVSGTETFNAGANYEFNGTAEQTTNFGTNNTLNNLTVNNTVGIKLSENITINGTLILATGDLDLNNFNITLNGTMVEDRANNHVVKDATATTEASQGGSIIFTTAVNTGTAELKGTGLYLKTTSGAYNVTVNRKHYRGAGASRGGKGIRRIYQITADVPANVTSSATEMRIYYATDELVDVSAPFVLYRWTSATGWEGGGASTAFDDGTNGTSPNYIQATNVSAFSHWTVGSGSTPLPVTLLGLKGERVEGLRGEMTEEIRLEWSTSSEINNKGFEVEMSENGRDYTKIAFIEGKGNSTTIQSYNHTTIQPYDSYYRLRQIDFDGKFSYSPIVFVEGLVGKVVVYPNPSNGTFTVVCGTQTTALDSPARLMNAQGTVVATSVATGKFATTGLPAGIYFLHTIVAGKTNITKIVIQ